MSCFKRISHTLLLTTVIVSCSSSSLEKSTYSPMTKEELFEEQGMIWLQSLCGEAFQGRRLGTAGNKLAFEYLEREITRMGYTPVCQEFKTESGVIGRNIIVSIPGQSDSTIIVGGHYDGAKQSSNGIHYQAANDNCSGTVALLLFLKSLKEKAIDTDRSVLCCFWDGEEVFDGEAFRGSRFFTSNISDSLKSCILHYENLDTIGHDHENIIYIEYSRNSRIRFLAEQISLNERFSYQISECSVYNSDYASFASVGIPFINYHDHKKACDRPNHSNLDVKEAISISRLVKVVNNVRESIKHY